MDVYTYVYKVAVEEGGDVYRRDYAGQIKIDSIVDSHFARANVISGLVKKHDVTEFVRKF